MAHIKNLFFFSFLNVTQMWFFFCSVVGTLKGLRGCKESAYKAGDLGLIPGSRNYPGEGNGNSLQYSCLENSMDRGAWWATVHGVSRSWTQLSD